ncbi:MAG TPA: pitrilysin family protein, partial [Stellaceae bacterium]|nr:pitrilysin family protein [Stellaceae bacterium]
MTRRLARRAGSAPRLLFAVALLLGAALAPGVARAAKIEPVTSPGGIVAWLVEDHSLPVVTFDVSFRGGAALDPPDKAGLANFTADLLDEGAGDLDSPTFQGRLEDLAASFEASVSEDAVSLSLRSITANLAPSLDLLRLALTEPRFDAAAVARVRGQLLDELARDAQEPHYIAGRLWWRNAMGDHPYARPSHGTPESVARITADDMHAFVPQRFGRDVMLIGVVGDVTPQALADLLDKTFGALPAKAAPGAVADVAVAAKDKLLLAKLPIPQSV